MARSLRIQAPGLWHHVMNRGLARGAIFVDDGDREGFYVLLADVRSRWGVRTHAACLMDNHVHLLVEDVRGEMGRAMRHVFGVYTQRYNRRHGRDGPLFRGRFRSRLVQQERYLAELVRYIHMNPVSAGLVPRAGEYSWSSHRHYLHGERPEWLDTEEVLGRFAHDRLELDRFVHARVAAEACERLDWSRHATVVGDDTFEASWRDHLRIERPTTTHVAADVRRWLATDPTEVLRSVGRHFGLSTAQLLEPRRGRTNHARQVAILVCVDHTPQDNTQLAAALHLRKSSLSSLASRYRRRLDTDEAFRRDVEAVMNALHASSRLSPQ